MITYILGLYNLDSTLVFNMLREHGITPVYAAYNKKRVSEATKFSVNGFLDISGNKCEVGGQTVWIDCGRSITAHADLGVFEVRRRETPQWFLDELDDRVPRMG